MQASIELLDAEGEDGLTVRALTAHLSTGRGAIYHHVAGKDDLLAAGTDAVIAEVITAAGGDQDPSQALRALALGIFDAIDAHPWVGAQLARQPQPAIFRLWTGIGTLLGDLGVAEPDLPTAGSALVSYVLGASAQYAAGARRAADGEDREAHLQQLAEQWAGDEANPAPGDTAALLVEHDDRDQFLAGVDIFLAGIAAQM